jgi:hypothetical protein
MFLLMASVNARRNTAPEFRRHKEQNVIGCRADGNRYLRRDLVIVRGRCGEDGNCRELIVARIARPHECNAIWTALRPNRPSNRLAALRAGILRRGAIEVSGSH